MTQCLTFWMSCNPPGASQPYQSCALKDPGTLVDDLNITSANNLISVPRARIIWRANGLGTAPTFLQGKMFLVPNSIAKRFCCSLPSIDSCSPPHLGPPEGKNFTRGTGSHLQSLNICSPHKYTLSTCCMPGVTESNKTKIS